MRELAWRWALQPHVIVLLTALLVVGGVLLASYLFARRQRVTARVEVDAPIVEVAPAPSASASQAVALPDGEVARLAARVREVSAVVMGLTLVALQEAIAGQAPVSSEALTARFAALQLLPPTMRMAAARGVLESELALLYVRYRSEPLAVEVISIGRATTDGAPIIGRIITGSEEQAALFIARQSKAAVLPDPFAPAAQVLALNWSAEPWRERLLPAQEFAALTQALRAAEAKP